MRRDHTRTGNRSTKVLRALAMSPSASAPFRLHGGSHVRGGTSDGLPCRFSPRPAASRDANPGASATGHPPGTGALPGGGNPDRPSRRARCHAAPQPGGAGRPADRAAQGPDRRRRPAPARVTRGGHPDGNRTRQHQPRTGRVRGGSRLVDRSRRADRSRVQRPFRGLRDSRRADWPGACRGERHRIRGVGPRLRRGSQCPDFGVEFRF